MCTVRHERDHYDSSFHLNFLCSDKSLLVLHRILVALRDIIQMLIVQIHRFVLPKNTQYIFFVGQKKLIICFGNAEIHDLPYL